MQALAHPEDCLLAEEVAKADPEVQRKLREEYGITNLDMVACDPWSGMSPHCRIFVLHADADADDN